jgi:hypothetical protein
MQRLDSGKCGHVGSSEEISNIKKQNYRSKIKMVKKRQENLDPGPSPPCGETGPG